MTAEIITTYCFLPAESTPELAVAQMMFFHQLNDNCSLVNVLLLL